MNNSKIFSQYSLHIKAPRAPLRLEKIAVFLSLLFTLLPPALCQPLNGSVDKSDQSGTPTQSLDGSASAQASTPSRWPNSTSPHTLQGSASSTQTRLVRPLAGEAGQQGLNGGVDGAPPTAPIDFTKAFPSLEPDNASSRRLTGGDQSDLGIIGEIESIGSPHVITRVLASSPAQEAGMVVGDILLTADGKEAMPRWIIGVPGTPVTIVWSHKGNIRTSVLIRREAGRIPMEPGVKQEYLKQVGGFFTNFRGW